MSDVNNPDMVSENKITQTVRFGPHLIFDAYGCPLEKLNDMELCFDVLNELARLAGMKKLTEPYILKADSNETLGGKDPGGFTGFLVIQESHISIHTFARRGFVTIDLYSCREFEIADAVEYLKKTFEPKEVDIVKLDRGLKYPSDNIY